MIHDSHVKRKNGTIIYILPMCGQHNTPRSQECFEIKQYYVATGLIHCPDSN